MPDLTPGVRPPEHRVEVRCDSCGIYDDHPRHITVVDMHLGIVRIRHMDCCHHAGCPGSQAGDNCSAVLAASGNAHGHDLTRWLEARQRG